MAMRRNTLSRRPKNRAQSIVKPSRQRRKFKASRQENLAHAGQRELN